MRAVHREATHDEVIVQLHDLPVRVPVNLEEEMDFDAEAIRSGVRIAEFY